MNLTVINASPRKRGNTAELCKNVVEGAQSNGANVEYIDLYTYDFKGCMRDDLKEVLQMCLDSDAIVIGTPIYYGSISSSAQAFLERLLFAADT